MRTGVLSTVVVVVLTLSGRGWAQDQSTPDRAISEAKTRLAAGEVKPALSILKQAMKQWPDSEMVRTELAAAYLADHNGYWALNVLHDFEVAHPPACASRWWMVMVHIEQANLDLAEEVLDRPGCDATPQDRARAHLLRARISQLRGAQPPAAEHVKAARKQSALYEEDARLLNTMDTRLFPGRLPWASWRIDTGVGWTSNGLAGSPVDRANVSGSTGSAVLSVDTRVRFVLPERASVRASVEGSFRTLQLAAQQARDLSYIAPGIRPGVLFGEQHPRLLLAYSFDAVRLSANDRYANTSVWFGEGHRMEYEIEASESWLAFGGAGRRFFREQGRTRWEADTGIATSIALGKGARVLTGVSARWNRADNPAYHSMGGTAIAQFVLPLPYRMEGRLNGSYSHEQFPQSKGYFAGSLGQARVDNTMRIKPGIWSPTWNGVRLGLDYEYTKRASAADAYAYTDHRTLLHVSWNLDSDRLGVSTIDTQGRTPLSHSAQGAMAASDEVRIRDLMRQDEAVKQGSSCLK